ncbi:MAG: hypothetical protein E3J87_05520 [Candidatus Cloacimonadota bacterium]|nr:MAG: hypothetical protein E3J87_05520 [Candidatus Cloacimonadota bacterium]
MSLLLFYTLFFMRINSISGFLPEDAVLTQTIKGDCIGNGKEEIIIVYDINARFGTRDYKGTCVSVLQEIGEKYQEVYKFKLSADTKIRLVKIFDEFPPFLEVQWFQSIGGGNTYICYDNELKRFREILHLESGGLNKEDIDGDGKEEIFSFKFETIQCNEEEDEINAGFLRFYRWVKNYFVSSPENAHIMRPRMTFFATAKTVFRPDFFKVIPEHYSSREYRGSEDLSFEFSARRDTTAVYLNIVVRDDIILQNEGGQNIVQGDHLKILLDTDIEKDFCSKSVDYDDVVIGISPGNFFDVSPDIVNLNPSSTLSENITEHSEFLIEKQSGGYKVFVRLSLDKKTLKKVVLGFGIILYDRDEKGSTLPEFETSWPLDIDENNPTTWGNLYLFEH